MSKYKDLFNWLEKKCNFHEKEEGNPNSITWTCYGDLRFTEEFCKSHNIDFEKVKERLNNTGGYCDCEVLFNSVERIPEETELEKIGVE